MSVTVIFKGLIVMIVGILAGVVLNFGILVPLTELHSGLVERGVYNVASIWDSRDDVDFLITLTHMCVYMVPVLSILYFIVTIVKTLRYDTQEDEELDYGSGNESW